MNYLASIKETTKAAEGNLSLLQDETAAPWGAWMMVLVWLMLMSTMLAWFAYQTPFVSDLCKFQV